MSARWIASALVALLVGVIGCGEEDATVAPSRTADPVATFAPMISLHSRERSFPVSARRFIDWSTVKWERGDCFPVTLAVGAPRHRAGLDDSSLPILDPAHLGGGESVYGFRPRSADCPTASPRRFAADEHTRPSDPGRPGLSGETGFYLDLATDELDGQRKLKIERGQAVVDALPVYYERIPARVDGRPGLRIVYWFLYGHTGPPADEQYMSSHEGGWEHVSVLLRRGARNHYTPESVRYHAWDERVDVPWTEVTRVDSTGAETNSGTHPLVFSALGSHASYPEPGDHERTVPGDGGRVKIVDRAVACSSCPQWRTWRRLSPLRRQPWYGFGGGWGRVFKGAHTNGPLGPSPFRPSK